MVIWSGKGLWLGTLVALAIVSASKSLGPWGVAVGCACAGAIVLALNPWAGEGSSLFFVPARYWPPLLFVLALITGAEAYKNRGTPSRSAADETTKAVAELRAALPRKLGEQMRLDRMEYADKTLRYRATSLNAVDGSLAQQKAAMAELARKHYCGDAKKLWAAGIGAEFEVQIPPKTLNDRFSSFAINVSPKECDAGK